MKKLLSVLLCLLPFALHAQDKPRPDIDELLKVSRVQQLSAGVMTRMRDIMTKSIEHTAGASGALTGKQKEMGEKVFEIIQSAMSWDKMEPEYARIYAEVFSPDEVKQLIAFYKSPIGQTFLDKQPILMRKSMDMSQGLMTSMLPKIQAAIRSEAFAAATGDETTTSELNGKYVLAERPKGVEAIDSIQFHPDGSCVFDIDGQTGIAGKYYVSPKDMMTIQGGTNMFTYQVARNSVSLTLTAPTAQLPLYYASLAKQQPGVTFNDVTGTFLAHNSYGDCVTQIAPDHQFHLHFRAPHPQDHTYSEYFVDGKCSFADGIITYTPEHSTARQQDQYVRDVVIKRDQDGLYVVDVFENNILCEKPVTTLDLPPLPPGYHQSDE